MTVSSVIVRQQIAAQPVNVEEAVRAFLERLDDEDPYMQDEDRNLEVLQHVSEQWWSFEDASAFVRGAWARDPEAEGDALTTYSANLHAVIDDEYCTIAGLGLEDQPYLTVQYR